MASRYRGSWMGLSPVVDPDIWLSTVAGRYTTAVRQGTDSEARDRVRGGSARRESGGRDLPHAVPALQRRR
ncbi:unnamed protein product, partial [Iphiclides podalirius]